MRRQVCPSASATRSASRRIGIAAQHVACTGHLQHHGSQPVSNEVVNLPSYAPPFCKQGLFGELGLGGRELSGQVRLAGEAAADDPGSAIPTIQMPTAISDGS